MHNAKGRCSLAFAWPEDVAPKCVQGSTFGCASPDAFWVQGSCAGLFWCNGHVVRCGHKRLSRMHCTCSGPMDNSTSALMSRIGPSVMCPPPALAAGPEPFQPVSQPVPPAAAVSAASGPWQLDDASRFASMRASRHPGFPTGGCGASYGPEVSDCCASRNLAAFTHTLGHIWRPSAARGGRLIYLDLGANAPASSIRPFRVMYPEGESFTVTAFEADPAWFPLYEPPCCHRHASCDVKLVHSGIGSGMVKSETVAYIDGGNSSKHTVARSVSSSARSNHKVAIRVTNLIHWLSRHIRHEDWLVCKMVRPRASKLSKPLPLHSKLSWNATYRRRTLRTLSTRSCKSS